jgi:hypothetical protein
MVCIKWYGLYKGVWFDEVVWFGLNGMVWLKWYGLYKVVWFGWYVKSIINYPTAGWASEFLIMVLKR